MNDDGISIISLHRCSGYDLEGTKEVAEALAKSLDRDIHSWTDVDTGVESIRTYYLSDRSVDGPKEEVVRKPRQSRRRKSSANAVAKSAL